jgi:hypothetical protein
VAWLALFLGPGLCKMLSPVIQKCSQLKHPAATSTATSSFLMATEQTYRGGFLWECLCDEGLLTLGPTHFSSARIRQSGSIRLLCNQ